MSPETKEPAEDVETPEITAEEFPEWHALAIEAMEEADSGAAERWA